ncbi:Ribosomal protein S18 acetylase RimI [Halolactibacillus halophilus]|uniref:Ribosomal protein S18 acetylase RimI n=1 Tax=Halolactibacillus halophilus TaxID=306540 RepID=A0A1I5RUB1_9BACI|nr:GNAT family N-acetyltransferase [Halolactibacillus halophilus]GEM02339.1 hypothetical protein HHA03_18710 [Halolactibacillus halophilus]SFP62125.1 Ribosomal protein S18 acetylase RimI [Halolactibacillus halophilus]
MIRLAIETDLAAIMGIVKEVIEEMGERGSVQWSSNYPSCEDFLRDIKKSELYVCEQAEGITGMCTFSHTGHEEYGEIPFTTTNALTIKRLAVSPSHRNKGISHQFMAAILQLAEETNKAAINGDTFKNNPHAQKFFLKHEFQWIAERPDDDRDVPLYYFERLLK